MCLARHGRRPAHSVGGMPVARLPLLVIDCPDVSDLAAFYGAMLGWEVEVISEDRSAVRSADGAAISFHRVDSYSPPAWPSQDRPQQMHLDVLVDNLDEAEAELLGLGAAKHELQPGGSFRVLLDPAGHPFCICLE